VSEGEDRFSDLGAGDGRRSAAERLEERDRTHPEPGPRRPEVPRPSSRYAWLVGIVFFIAIVVAAINAIPNSGRSLRGPKPGTFMPRFSAPDALGDKQGVANVKQSLNDRGSGNRTPACAVRGAGVVNSCQLTERPVVLTFVFDRGADCFPQVDRVERMMRTVPGVNFPVVYFSRKDRDEVREIVRRRGWTMPVAVDGDGKLTDVYRIGGCPITVFAKAGGRVRSTKIGFLTEGELRAAARRLRR
jgi:peroxiredoxin